MLHRFLSLLVPQVHQESVSATTANERLWFSFSSLIHQPWYEGCIEMYILYQFFAPKHLFLTISYSF